MHASRAGSIPLFAALLAVALPVHADGPARRVVVDASTARYLPAPWGLSRDERAELMAGAVVQRPVAFQRRGGSYVGGVSYQVVRARPGSVLAALQRVDALPSALPRTKRARLVERRREGALVELTQGNALVEATYTVLLSRSGPNELRFWLDDSRPHGVDDLWGFFRVRPFGDGATLVTVAAVVDLGPGLARLLFERRVQQVILRAPRHIRDFVET